MSERAQLAPKSVSTSGEDFPWELFGKSLDCYFASELRVSCPPHLAHAALAEGGDHFIVRNG